MIYSASRGFHEYRKIWSSKFSRTFDSYTMGLYCRIKGIIENPPHKIPRFCKFYSEYNGELNANVHSTKF